MEQFEEIAKSNSACEVNFRGVRLPVFYKKGRGKKLLVIFHGAVDQASRKLPFFQAHCSVGSHQISISDPTLFSDVKLKAGWYLGREGQQLTEILSEFIILFSEHIGVQERVYFGGSAGGFSALQMSARDQGSIAVVCNPQTSLSSYVNSNVEKLRAVCWPMADSLQEFSEMAPIDLIGVYKNAKENLVVYLQSSGDFQHISTQMIPFLSSLSDSQINRTVLVVGFWGVKGHSGAVPSSIWLPWVRAALVAQNLCAEDLLETHHKMVQTRDQVLHSAVRSSSSINPADLSMADLLRNLQLNS